MLELTRFKGIFKVNHRNGTSPPSWKVVVIMPQYCFSLGNFSSEEEAIQVFDRNVFRFKGWAGISSLINPPVSGVPLTASWFAEELPITLQAMRDSFQSFSSTQHAAGAADAEFEHPDLSDAHSSSAASMGAPSKDGSPLPSHADYVAAKGEFMRGEKVLAPAQYLASNMMHGSSAVSTTYQYLNSEKAIKKGGLPMKAPFSAVSAQPDPALIPPALMASLAPVMPQAAAAMMPYMLQYHQQNMLLQLLGTLEKHVTFPATPVPAATQTSATATTTAAAATPSVPGSESTDQTAVPNQPPPMPYITIYELPPGATQVKATTLPVAAAMSIFYNQAASMVQQQYATMAALHQQNPNAAGFPAPAFPVPNAPASDGAAATAPSETAGSTSEQEAKKGDLSDAEESEIEEEDVEPSDEEGEDEDDEEEEENNIDV
jgi:hypothetical protein